MEAQGISHEGLRIQINTYMTGELDLDELKDNSPCSSQWAGKKWAGRPNWARVFKAVAKEADPKE
eukprot:608477-Pyramimonas_sp.AAC.1